MNNSISGAVVGKGAAIAVVSNGNVGGLHGNVHRIRLRNAILCIGDSNGRIAQTQLAGRRCAVVCYRLGCAVCVVGSDDHTGLIKGLTLSIGGLRRLGGDVNALQICTPVGGVCLVTRAACGNRHSGLRRIAVAARPTEEGVALLRRVVQRNGRRLNRILRRIGGHSAAIEVIANGVGDQIKVRSHRYVAGGHLEGQSILRQGLTLSAAICPLHSGTLIGITGLHGRIDGNGLTVNGYSGIDSHIAAGNGVYRYHIATEVVGPAVVQRIRVDGSNLGAQRIDFAVGVAQRECAAITATSIIEGDVCIGRVQELNRCQAGAVVCKKRAVVHQSCGERNTLQSRAETEHIVRICHMAQIPAIQVDVRKVFTELEHALYIGDCAFVPAAQVNGFNAGRLKHLAHGPDLRCVPVFHVDCLQIGCALEHARSVFHVADIPCGILFRSTGVHLLGVDVNLRQAGAVGERIHGVLAGRSVPLGDIQSCQAAAGVEHASRFHHTGGIPIGDVQLREVIAVGEHTLITGGCVLYVASIPVGNIDILQIAVAGKHVTGFHYIADIQKLSAIDACQFCKAVIVVIEAKSVVGTLVGKDGAVAVAGDGHLRLICAEIGRNCAGHRKIRHVPDGLVAGRDVIVCNLNGGQQIQINRCLITIVAGVAPIGGVLPSIVLRQGRDRSTVIPAIMPAVFVLDRHHIAVHDSVYVACYVECAKGGLPCRLVVRQRKNVAVRVIKSNRSHRRQQTKGAFLDRINGCGNGQRAGKAGAVESVLANAAGSAREAHGSHLRKTVEGVVAHRGHAIGEAEGFDHALVVGPLGCAGVGEVLHGASVVVEAHLEDDTIASLVQIAVQRLVAIRRRDAVGHSRRCPDHLRGALQGIQVDVVILGSKANRALGQINFNERERHRSGGDKRVGDRQQQVACDSLCAGGSAKHLLRQREGNALLVLAYLIGQHSVANFQCDVTVEELACRCCIGRGPGCSHLDAALNILCAGVGFCNRYSNGFTGSVRTVGRLASQCVTVIGECGGGELHLMRCAIYKECNGAHRQRQQNGQRYGKCCLCPFRLNHHRFPPLFGNILLRVHGAVLLSLCIP